MHADLEHLVALDRLDRAVERSDKAVADARQALVDKGAALTAAREKLASLKAEVQASRDAQHAGERQAKRYRDRKQSAENVLQSGIGDYEAAQRQIAECNRILDDLETTILEQLELQDELAGAIQTAEATIEGCERALAEQEAATPKVVAAEKVTRADLLAERKTHEAQLPADFLDRYERLCARKKRAVAPVRQDACGACMQSIKAQERIELKRDRMVECGSCHRWLYNPEPL